MCAERKSKSDIPTEEQGAIQIERVRAPLGVSTPTELPAGKRLGSAGHAMSALHSPAREEAASARLLPSLPSFAPGFRITIFDSLPALSSNLLVFIGFSPTECQKRVTHLFSSTHREHFLPLLFSISHWDVSSFLFNDIPGSRR
jgi:hypothetical protein